MKRRCYSHGYTWLQINMALVYWRTGRLAAGMDRVKITVHYREENPTIAQASFSGAPLRLIYNHSTAAPHGPQGNYTYFSVDMWWFTYTVINPILNPACGIIIYIPVLNRLLITGRELRLWQDVHTGPWGGVVWPCLWQYTLTRLCGPEWMGVVGG